MIYLMKSRFYVLLIFIAYLIILVFIEDAYLFKFFSFVFACFAMLTLFSHRLGRPIQFKLVRQTELPNKDALFLQSILKTKDIGIMVIDYDGHVQYMNETFVDYFHTLEPIKHIQHLAHIPELFKSLNLSMAIETTSEFITQLNGQTYACRVTSIFNESTFVGLTLIVKEHTDKFLLEQHQLNFLADIAHEIKTPLAAILGASRILTQDERKLSKEERIEFQEGLERETDRLNRLTSKLSDLSRIQMFGQQTLVKSKFSLKKLLEEAGQTFKLPLQEKKLAFTLNVPDDLMLIADRDKMFQVFVNLFANAIQHTLIGGITIQAYVEKDTVIKFMDTGVGIDPSSSKRIFERFYRADKSRSSATGGQGLGLAITRAIIIAHQGNIRVESKVNQGTAFIIELPTSS
jgi:two-component system phosphate regulon sensor histidine kinase PhoR